MNKPHSFVKSGYRSIVLALIITLSAALVWGFTFRWNHTTASCVGREQATTFAVPIIFVGSLTTYLRKAYSNWRLLDIHSSNSTDCSL